MLGPDAVDSCALQERLLEMEWPEAVLAHPACETCVMMDTVMFNGPRVKVGMVSGSVSKKMPNKTTGRTEYFGRFRQAMPKQQDGRSLYLVEG